MYRDPSRTAEVATFDDPATPEYYRSGSKRLPFRRCAGKGEAEPLRAIPLYGRPRHTSLERARSRRAPSRSQRNSLPPHSSADLPDTVLVVDDHQGAREVISRMLEEGGFTVVAADSGAAAIALLSDATHTIDAIVTDVSMPDMTGVELAYYVREHFPSLPIAIVSGDIGDLERSVIARAGVPFLKKPVRAEALQTAIREAMRAVGG